MIKKTIKPYRLPDRSGHFGIFGGKFVPETLMRALSELEAQLLIAAELGYLDGAHAVFSSVDRVSRLLTGLHKSVKE